MKNVLLFIGVIVIGFGFISCKKDDLVYSCDPTIDVWVKSNIDEIRVMSYDQFVSVVPIYQKAIFRAFTPQQKKSVWNKKIENLLSLDWSDVEREHIQALQSMLEAYTGVFSETVTEKEKDALFVEAYKWKSYSKEVLGWDDNLIRSMVGNPNALLDKRGTLKIEATPFAVLKSSSEIDCECSIYHEHVIINDCGSSSCFGSDICDSSSFGCGMWWGEDCDGECY